MANGLLEKQTLVDIAAAIREKGGPTDYMYPYQFADAIRNLEVGGSGEGGMATSIKEFGAVGDGVINDTAALKQAAASGKVVYFPEGTYLLYEQIDLSKDIHWVGDGEVSIIKLMPFDQSRPEEYGDRTVYNSYMFTQSETDNGYSIYLRNLVLDANKDGYDSDALGNGSTRYDHTTCLDMYKPHDVYMHNVIIRNALIEGAYFYDPSGTVLISDCQFIGNGFYQEDASGIHLEGDLSSVVISNCVFKDNGFHGLLTSGEHLKASNISCYDNGYSGVCLWGGASYNTISNVYSGGNQGGVCIKAQYSPNKNDYIDEDWLTYATGNVITGLVTEGNDYGVMFGYSKDTVINGWVSKDDDVSVFSELNEEMSTSEYVAEDVTGCISNAVFKYVRAKADKIAPDISKFKLTMITSDSDLVGSGDWYTEPHAYVPEWEIGRLSNSGGGTEAESSSDIRSVGYFKLIPSTTYTIEHSGTGSLAVFYYTDETGENYIDREYVENGEATIAPSSSTAEYIYARLLIEGETSLTTTVSFNPNVLCPVSVTWELGDISGGVDQTSETAIRSVGYLPCSPNTTYTFDYSSEGDLAAYWYSSNTDESFVVREYCASGSNIISPENAAYVRFKIDPETSTTISLYTSPGL